MTEVVAPHGSPLGIAVLGVERFETSREFYCDLIGFDAGKLEAWAGPDFESLWHLPAGSRARACLLTASGSAVGRILLVEFQAAHRKHVRGSMDSRAYGLVNLNFYTRDIRAAARSFAALGYELWSEPTQYDLAAAVGKPIEVVFEGPDGVAVNLVELASTDPGTRIGQMRAFVERHGYTRAGFTPVVTTSHVCRSIAKARAFYEQALRMGVLIDDEFNSPAVNAFLRLKPGSRTHITFMQGNHMFGKIALSEPLNYACGDLTPLAVAPNIGYLAQAFEVSDLARAIAGAAGTQAPIELEPRAMELPGLGRRSVAVVRNPGSGALQWLVESG
ncbi:MAG TPA: hypothetical protein PKL49_04635 [Steroidobacteraceae bacterium]|nr:hypothetical protein [Steroidobacteraceae bacterium]HNS26908.1 hypothetical protein [Steroidobacteraceae bacterium]